MRPGCGASEPAGAIEAFDREHGLETAPASGPAVSRRVILSGLALMASPVSLGLALDKGDLHVTRDLDGLLVYASGSVLRLSSARFGSADALSAPRRTGNVWTVEVAPFLLPGANPLRGTLTFRRLPDDKGGEWVVELRIHNLIRFQPVSYHEWSVGKAQLENRMSGAGGRTFLRRLLGGAFTVRGAATVTLGPDLLWKIASPAGIVAADAAVTMASSH